MTNAALIAWKESKSYFSTPMAYVVGATFLVLTGIFFVRDITAPFAEANVRGLVDWAGFFMIFLSPLLTMRLLAEEQKMGTLELLLTAPVRDWEVVAGKYVAGFIILTATMSLTLYYVLLLFWFGNPDTGPVVSAYLGLILHGGAALAVGLLASSLTSNQMVAAVVGTASLLALSFADRVADLLSGTAREVVDGMAMSSHFVDFSRGIVDTTHVAYYLSVAAVAVFLTIRSLEMRRWR